MEYDTELFMVVQKALPKEISQNKTVDECRWLSVEVCNLQRLSFFLLLLQLHQLV